MTAGPPPCVRQPHFLPKLKKFLMALHTADGQGFAAAQPT